MATPDGLKDSKITFVPGAGKESETGRRSRVCVL
jgi:hypothetical protein